MKKLSAPNAIPTWIWIWFSLVALPKVFRTIRQVWNGDYADVWGISIIVVMGLAFVGALLELDRRYLNEEIYDDGDALVVKKGLRREIRIPFSDIQRVTFRPCRTNNIHLEIDPPSKLGRTLCFNVNHEGTREDHNPIADDLHRRSRCCKTELSSGLGGKEAVAH